MNRATNHLRQAPPEPLKTIDIIRRGYGRRYSSLPVDLLEQEQIIIDCREAFVSAERYDIRADDLVRWREGERHIEARVAAVRIDDRQVIIALSHAQLLPEDFFPF